MTPPASTTTPITMSQTFHFRFTQELPIRRRRWHAICSQNPIVAPENQGQDLRVLKRRRSFRASVLPGVGRLSRAAPGVPRRPPSLSGGGRGGGGGGGAGRG